MNQAPSSSHTLPGRSCIACKRRKIRCNRLQPCSYCAKLRLQCIYPGPDRAAKEQPENDLLSRLKRIESSLQRLESSVASAMSPTLSGSILSHDNAYQEIPTETGSTSNEGNGKLLSKDGDIRFVNSSFWADLEDNEGDGAIEPEYHLLGPHSVPSTSNAELNQRQSLPLGFNSTATDLRQLHPLANRLFALWQVFLESVDPVLKIVHVPVTQRQILQASQNLASVPPAFECLMFAIYFAAVTSFRCSVSCRTLLHEERQDLLDRYRLGVELALAKANFMSTPDVTTLQALTLYLICARQTADKAYIWSMTGLLIRLATKLGLHRDPAALGLAPFLAEMRRRLWWQICILDVRTAEDSDVDPFICEHAFDTELPANVNDTELDPSMTQLVSVSQRRTEMMFTLARIEISYAARKLVFSTKFCVDNQYPNLSFQEKHDFIDSLQKVLDEKYLKYCDNTIPICNLTATSTRTVLAKIKLTLNHPASNGSAGVAQERLEDLVMSSIEIIEYAHMLRTNEKYSKWVWLFQKYIEWDAVAFLLHSLSAAPLPTLLDRAWKAVDVFFKAWRGHDQDGERRWQRLERLRFKAAAKQSPERSSQSDKEGACSDGGVLGQGLGELVATTPIRLEMMQPRDGPAVLEERTHEDRPAIDATNGAYITPSTTTAEHLDWSFDNMSYITQGAPSWEMDLDGNAFKEWL